MNTGDVAAGGDNAAFAPADDHRLVGKVRIVALFDRCIKRVAIHMRKRQGESISAMPDHAADCRRHGSVASPGAGRGEAIPAKAGYRF
jgi:hypothetical protein